MQQTAYDESKKKVILSSKYASYSKNASRPSCASECMYLFYNDIHCKGTTVLSDTIGDAIRKRKDDALTAMITFIDF